MINHQVPDLFKLLWLYKSSLNKAVFLGGGSFGGGGGSLDPVMVFSFDETILSFGERLDP